MAGSLPTPAWGRSKQIILLDGKPLREERKIYVLLYKPKGYLTTETYPDGRPTAYNLLYDIKQWVFPVGRLDQDTSGLLLLTNCDTDFAEHVTNPEHHVAKTYLVKTSSLLTDDQMESMRLGLQLKDCHASGAGGETSRYAGQVVLQDHHHGRAQPPSPAHGGGVR